MSKFNLDTIKGRYDYLVNERNTKIKELERILQGKDIRYKKYMDSDIFIQSVKKDLEIEKQLLNELLTDSFYREIQ